MHINIAGYRSTVIKHCGMFSEMLTGNSTRDALRILRSELEDQLNHYNNKRARLPLVFRLRDCCLHHLNARSVLHVTDVFIIVISVIFIMAAFVLQTYRYIADYLQCTGINCMKSG